MRRSCLYAVESPADSSRDKRIFSTGCAGESNAETIPVRGGYEKLSRTDENASLNDCFRDKKDWRLCKDEVRMPQGLSSEAVGEDR